MPHLCEVRSETMHINEFDSSDEELAESDQTQFDISWLSLEATNYNQFVGICSLPGCKFKDVRRNLNQNIGEMKNQGIQDIFVLCTSGELSLYRVPNLLQEYQNQDFVIHHHPFPDGGVPSPDDCCEILEDLKACLDNNRKTIIHCYGGLGCSCLIAACLLLYLSDTITPEEAIGHVRMLRGSGAIQTIKQYNFLNDFREKVTKCHSAEEETCRPVSR
ncbi:cyclin-dependent kinase inhibitor 3 [Pelodytes ibericus]